MTNAELASKSHSPQVATFDVTAEWGRVALTDLIPKSQRYQAWLGDTTELIGWGEFSRFEVSGPERFSRAQRWWQSLLTEIGSARAMRVANPATPWPRLVAFVSFGFFDEATSVLVVPEVLVLREGGRTWLTLIGDAKNHLDTPASRREHLAKVRQESTATKKDEAMRVEWANNEDDQVSWSEMVSSSVDRINAGELDKVVIARTARATALSPLDTVACLSTLRSRYQACWTFHVDDLFGATPELLVAKRGDLVHSKVLAGTIHPSSTNGEVSTTDEAVALAATLLESGKDLAEHEYAVSSVASALAQHCDDLNVPKRPSVLSLHGISHLATEITGQLVDAAPLLTLAASLHPTAAVCGTPRERALALIRETERIDRGRYAGPVGWLDSAGDGELGIALRCAAITESRSADLSVDVELTAYAGCGLVSESCPEDEWQESEAKLQAIKGLFAV